MAVSGIGGALLGATYMGASSATGFSPTDPVPSPWMGALYGGMVSNINPFTAAGTAWRGAFGINPHAAAGGGITPLRYSTGWDRFGELSVSGKQKAIGGGARFTNFRDNPALKKGFKYQGVLGWKTALLGVHDGAGVWARLSVGNIGLSTTQLIAKGIQGLAPDWEDPLLTKFTQARKLGLAGMFNVADAGAQTGKVLKHSWLYKLAGVDVSNAKLSDLKGMGIKGKGVKVTNDMLKQGFHIGAKTTSHRLISSAVGGFSLYAWLSLLTDVTAFGGRALAEGVGNAASNLYTFLNEVKKPEFGRGRVAASMMSQGAATERQRAISASYKAKVAPSNRMYGTEAMYHHSR
jgi:hypothetical protein|tara:strand:+ start:16138 stop:17184 length:1047 start_codon:yes stop_codon:yes gene_type:complete